MQYIYAKYPIAAFVFLLKNRNSEEKRRSDKKHVKCHNDNIGIVATNPDLEFTDPEELMTEPELTVTKSTLAIKSHSDRDAFIVIESSSESEDGSSLEFQEHMSKVTLALLLLPSFRKYLVLIVSGTFCSGV